jgi:SAM-dependent methyltransferase
MIDLACPSCHDLLPAGDSDLRCPKCGRAYPVVGGVPTFAAADEFYEGKWAAPDLSRGSPRNWLVKKQRFFLRRLAGRQGRLLDLGCGGGWAVFARAGETAGVDLSISSLQGARKLYDTVAAAELGALPFPDASFDYVVSSDVLGHVPLPGKDQVWKEMRRVLKPGGRTLHYIEADGSDPLMRFAKSDPALYRRHVVEPEGHVGMESARATFGRFRRLGFRPVVERGVYRMFLYLERVVQYFDNAYKLRSRLIRLLVAIARLARRRAALENLGNLAITALIELGDRLLPLSWSNGVLVEYVRV